MASFPKKEYKFINTYINFTINNFRGSQTLILSLSSVVEPLNFGWIHSEFKAMFPTSPAPDVAMWLDSAQSAGSGSQSQVLCGPFFTIFPFPWLEGRRDDEPSKTTGKRANTQGQWTKKLEGTRVPRRSPSRGLLHQPWSTCLQTYVRKKLISTWFKLMFIWL